MHIAADDTPALRRFGWQMAVAWPLLFGLALPWLFGSGWPLWPWCVALTFAVLAMLVPRLLYWPARGWQAFSQVMGWINTRIILALLFYLLITPLGVVLRLLGKLDYKRQPATGSSYWQQSDNIAGSNMKDPF